MSTSLFILFVGNGIIFTSMATVIINNMCGSKKIEWHELLCSIVFILVSAFFWSIAFGVLQIKGTF